MWEIIIERERVCVGERDEERETEYACGRERERERECGRER